MANDLSAFIPQILAQGLMALRENSIMPRLVNTDYSLSPGEKGSTVEVPIASAVPLVSVTPGATPPATADQSSSVVNIVMDTWYDAPFQMSDSDLGKVKAGTIPQKITEAMKTLGNAVDRDILALYKKVYGYVGTAGTTPFNTTDGLLAAKLARIAGNEQLMPVKDRRYVLDVSAEGNASMLPNFQDFSKSGDIAVIRDGMIGHKVGADWFMDHNVQTHQAGSLTGTIVVSGANAVGAKSVGLSAGSGEAVALLQGDIITFAGDTQTYVVTADLTVGASSTGPVLIEPGLQVATSGAEAVAVKASHVNNLLFHRDAFAFATRPLEDPGANSQSIQDPVSGVTLRLELQREYKRTRWSFDVLFGTQAILPQFGVRIAG